jgi:hypothetical protein
VIRWLAPSALVPRAPSPNGEGPLPVASRLSLSRGTDTTDALLEEGARGTRAGGVALLCLALLQTGCPYGGGCDTLPSCASQSGACAVAATDGGCGIEAALCHSDGLLHCASGALVTDAGPACPLPPFVPLFCVE